MFKVQDFVLGTIRRQFGLHHPVAPQEPTVTGTTNPGSPPNFRWDPPANVCRSSFHAAPPARQEDRLHRLVIYPLRMLAFYGLLALHSVVICSLQYALLGPLWLCMRALEKEKPTTQLQPSGRLRILYVRILQFLQRAWFNVFSLFAFGLAPTTLYVTGDEIDFSRNASKERVFVIGNHTTYNDWIYIWHLAQLSNAHGRVKIAFKKELQKAPIFGRGLSFFEFIGVARKWEKDEATLTKSCAQLRRDGDPFWFVLFPEGTILSDVTMEKNLRYASQKPVEPLMYQLVPRSRGAEHCLRQLGDGVDAIYDFTIGFEGAKPQYPQDAVSVNNVYVFGGSPRRVHMHIRRIPVEEVSRVLEEPVYGGRSPVRIASPQPAVLSEPPGIVPKLSLTTATTDSHSSGEEPRRQTTISTISEEAPLAPKKKSCFDTNSALSSPAFPQMRHLLSEGIASTVTSVAPTPVETPFFDWLLHQYRVKDALLDQFYRTGEFPMGARTSPLLVPIGERLFSGGDYSLLQAWILWFCLLWCFRYGIMTAVTVLPSVG